MDVKEFTNIIKEELPDFLPEEVYKDLVIDDVEIAKMNDQKLHGLTFKPKGSDAAPTLYILFKQKVAEGIQRFCNYK